MNSVSKCEVDQPQISPDVATITRDYADLFTGIGMIWEKMVTLHIDDSVTPKQQPHRLGLVWFRGLTPQQQPGSYQGGEMMMKSVFWWRKPEHPEETTDLRQVTDETFSHIRPLPSPGIELGQIPFHIRKDVERELARLVEMDILEKTDGPTPWVSPIVVVPKKSGEVRICVDMREANVAIKREKHLIPTIDDLIAYLNGAAMFSTLDLRAGFHQLPLAPKSRQITTFSTHVGLFRYKRLVFGINAAAEIFQNAISELLHDLPGCRNISDDRIVYGHTPEEHNANLKRVLQRLREKNARLNMDKCRFSQSEVTFYGQVFGKQGIRADPQKVKAITDMPSPTNVSEIRLLLGMAQYIARYIPNFAAITAPLCELTKDSPWKWGQAEALSELKVALTNSHTMTYFNPSRPAEVLVDASPKVPKVPLSPRRGGSSVMVAEHFQTLNLAIPRLKGKCWRLSGVLNTFIYISMELGSQ